MNDGDILPAILFTGRFGSGKTETAINYARALVQGAAPGMEFEPADGQSGGPADEVVLVDLDIVTPYFRSREMAARLLEQGVRAMKSTTGHTSSPKSRPTCCWATCRC